MAGQELLAFSPLFGRGLLVIGETQLLAAHYPVLASEHTAILAQSGLVFQGFPNGAKLSVNGSIASSFGLTVYPDAIIGGNGLLPNTIIQSGAILAPGNSIGQLTAPSLNFSGTLNTEFQGPQNDKTTVTGSVPNFTGSANLFSSFYGLELKANPY